LGKRTRSKNYKRATKRRTFPWRGKRGKRQNVGNSTDRTGRILLLRGRVRGKEESGAGVASRKTVLRQTP